MSGSCIRVPGRRRITIRQLAASVRAALKIDDPYFPVEKVLEFALPQIWDDYVFCVRDAQFMGADHGRTYPDERRIEVREDVYRGACSGVGRDRFTLAHEFGHLLLHRGVLSLGRAIAEEKVNVRPYESSEWQANTFASELLMTVDVAQGIADASALAAICGVSERAAEVRMETLEGEGLRRK